MRTGGSNSCVQSFQGGSQAYENSCPCASNGECDEAGRGAAGDADGEPVCSGAPVCGVVCAAGTDANDCVSGTVPPATPGLPPSSHVGTPPTGPEAACYGVATIKSIFACVTSTHDRRPRYIHPSVGQLGRWSVITF